VTPEIALVLSILAASVVLLITEWIPMGVTVRLAPVIRGVLMVAWGFSYR